MRHRTGPARAARITVVPQRGGVTGLRLYQPAARSQIAAAGPQPATRRRAGIYFPIALSNTTLLQASGPGSFLITGALPPESRTLTVRW